MKERPILFNGPMVRAILDGRKTQTRRIMKMKSKFDDIQTANAIHPDGSGQGWIAWWSSVDPTAEETAKMYPGNEGFACPNGTVADRLWVRERHARIQGQVGFHSPHYFADGPMPTLEERHDTILLKSYPSIHMPRWASRIDLEITGVRVERLQDISEEDAVAEGIEFEDFFGCNVWRNYLVDGENFPSLPVDSYRTLWESINGPGSWDANPWVWVIEFKRINHAS